MIPISVRADRRATRTGVEESSLRPSLVIRNVADRGTEFLTFAADERAKKRRSPAAGGADHPHDVGSVVAPGSVIHRQLGGTVLTLPLAVARSCFGSQLSRRWTGCAG